jgi:hypothetical protein
LSWSRRRHTASPLHHLTYKSAHIQHAQHGIPTDVITTFPLILHLLGLIILHIATLVLIKANTITMAPFTYITHLPFYDTNIAFVMDAAVVVALVTADVHIVSAAAVDTTTRRGEGRARFGV